MVLRGAAHLSSGLLGQFTDFELPERYFMKRVLFYSLPGRRSRVVDEFEAILSCALEGGSPRAGLRGPLSLNLGLGLALRASISGFCEHMIPALSVASRQTFDHAAELGLAD